LRYFLSRRAAPLTGVLLIESGSRSLIEGIVPHLRATWARDVPIDLLTCFGGVPAGLGAEGTVYRTVVYRTTDYTTPERRNELLGQLRARNYSMVGMICSGEPIMTKWKWMIALRLPVKVFIINENGDYFWVNREQSAVLREFCLVRMGLQGEGAIRTIGRLLIFPFSLLFLVLYAFVAHSRRMVRQMLHPDKT
jgi:hypothetical protein